MGQIWIANADGSHRHALTPLMPVPRSLSWAPDGHAIVFTAGAGEARHVLWTVDARTRTLTNLGQGGSNSSWSPDGAWIAYLTLGIRGGEVDLIRPSGGPPTYVYPYGYTPGVKATPLVWSPDSRFLAIQGYLFPIDGSEPLETDVLGWSGDGAFKLTRDRKIVNVATGRVAGTVPPSIILRPRLAPDGTAVAGTTIHGEVRVASVRTGIVVSAPHGQSASDTVSWSPEHQLAYVGSGPCGPRSQINIFQTTRNTSRVLAKTCKPTR
jgi:dipeptidyl aminopeptidase/acylaminoacyl peptidase